MSEPRASAPPGRSAAAAGGRPSKPSSVRLMTTRRGEFPQIQAIGHRSPFYEDIYHSILTRPWWQFFLVACGVFLGVNAIFAGLYTAQAGAIANARSSSFEDAFFFSVQTMATIGYGGMAPATRFAHIIVTVEALTGTLYTALLTGLTFAKFARPRARVLFSEKAVVAPRNGVPHLMFRMANWRRNNIVEAQLRVVLLVIERTTEGEEMRRPIELPLVRDRNAVFILTWSAMHRIDETSPFYGPDAAERLRAMGAQIFLTITGTDETIGQTVHARYAYDLNDILWDWRFVDVLRVLPDGTRIIDYARFHEVSPIDTARRG